MLTYNTHLKANTATTFRFLNHFPVFTAQTITTQHTTHSVSKSYLGWKIDTQKQPAKKQTQNPKPYKIEIEIEIDKEKQWEIWNYLRFEFENWIAKAVWTPIYNKSNWRFEISIDRLYCHKNESLSCWIVSSLKACWIVSSLSRFTEIGCRGSQYVEDVCWRSVLQASCTTQVVVYRNDTNGLLSLMVCTRLVLNFQH